MKKLLVILITVVSLMLAGCDQQIGTIGNGKVDPIEKPLIRAAVKKAYTVKPGIQSYVYTVTALLLKNLTPETIAQETLLDKVIQEQVNTLGLTPDENKEFMEFIQEFRKALNEQLIATYGVRADSSKIYVVVMDVIKVVNEASAPTSN